MLYILWLDLADGQGGQSPVFYNLLMVGAASLVARIDPRHRRGDGIAAMALVGLALQVKYTVMFEGVWIGVWLMWDEHRRTRSIGQAAGYGAVLCLVALVPTLVATGIYVAIGQGAGVRPSPISCRSGTGIPMQRRTSGATPGRPPPASAPSS